MRPIGVICAVVLALPAEADELSAIDVQLLIERLEELQGGAEGRTATRYSVARNAFAEAIRSDDAAHELYLKCVEKVRFTDEKLSSQDFREWKRRHGDRTDSPEFRRALRHQLSWLLLTLEAASNPGKKDELGAKATNRIDTIFADADDLEGEQERLRQNVLESVYATAYGLNGIEIEKWPAAPLALGEVYENLILPPLRKPDHLEALRAAWMKRILHEGSVHEKWGRAAKLKGGREGRAVELDKFLADRRPELLWAMEVDLFKVGDERGAAKRMLVHIEKHLGHKNEEKWIREFTSLVKGEPPEGEKKKRDS